MFWVGAVLLILGCFVAIGNWICFFGKKSTIPFVGSALLAGGLACSPEARPYMILSLLDIGTILLFLSSPRILSDLWSTSRFNLVSRYQSKNVHAFYTLSLFKKNIFAIDARIHPTHQQESPQLIRFGLSGTWHVRGTDIVLEKFSEDRILILRKEGAAYMASEERKQQKMLPFTDFDGLEFTRI